MLYKLDASACSTSKLPNGNGSGTYGQNGKKEVAQRIERSVLVDIAAAAVGRMNF